MEHAGLNCARLLCTRGEGGREEGGREEESRRTWSLVFHLGARLFWKGSVPMSPQGVETRNCPSMDSWDPSPRSYPWYTRNLRLY